MARGRHPTRILVEPPDEQTAAKYLLRWLGGDLYREPRRFPRLASTDLFGNEKPLEIDFGCGTGALALDRARKLPNVNFVGIDRSQKPLYLAVREAAAAGLDNIRFIRGNFHEMLRLLPPCAVGATYYLFPNPPKDYHKERANARRKNFLNCVHDALIPGGRFHFATDSPEFFECMSAVARGEPRYKMIDGKKGEAGLKTDYRLLWENRGRAVLSFVIEK
jgi:tRNA (guanine-N7-)-methyltransferase